MELNEKQIQKLVLEAQDGSEEGMAALYDVFNLRIYRFFIYRVSTCETAEDLTQTVFLEMIRSLSRYKNTERAKFSTWLFQIARFRLIDYYRKNRITSPLEDINEEAHEQLHADPEEVTFDVRAEEAWKTIKTLPENYQTVLHFTYVEDLSITEIAEVLGASVANVRVIKFRALKKLKVAMNDNVNKSYDTKL